MRTPARHLVFSLLACVALLTAAVCAPGRAASSVAILPIAGDGLDPWLAQNFDPSKALTSLLTDRVVNLGKVSVVEREHVDKVFDEQKLSQSADFSTQDAVKLGHTVGANYLIMGRIVHFDKVAQNSSLIGGLLPQSPVDVSGAGASTERIHCQVTIRVVDTNTGRIVRTYQFDQTKTGTSFSTGDFNNGGGGYQSQQFTSSVVGKLLDAAADDLAKQISAGDYNAASGPSIQALIIAADGDSLILNKGSSDGVTAGTFFNTFHQIAAKDPSTGKTLVTDVPDGQIQVISVSPNSAVARKVSGTPGVHGIARS